MTSEPLEATVTLRGIVFCDGSVLIVERTTDGGWELPGGRLDSHEDAVPGLQREITEETGLDPQVEEPIHTLSWRNTDDCGRFAVYFRCQCERQEIVLSDEHTEAAWVSPATAKQRLSDPQGTAVMRATGRSISKPS